MRSTRVAGSRSKIKGTYIHRVGRVTSSCDSQCWRDTVVRWPSRDALLFHPLSLSLYPSLFFLPFTLYYQLSVYSYASYYALARERKKRAPWVASTRTHARTHTHTPFLTLKSRIVIISSPAIAVGKASGSRLEATAISASRKARRGNQPLRCYSQGKRRWFDVAVAGLVHRQFVSRSYVRIPGLVLSSRILLLILKKKEILQISNIIYVKLYKIMRMLDKNAWYPYCSDLIVKLDK